VGDDALVLGSVVFVDAVEESLGAGSIVCPADDGELVGSAERVASPDEPLLQPVKAAAPKPNDARPNPTRANILSGARGRPADDAAGPSA